MLPIYMVWLGFAKAHTYPVCVFLEQGHVVSGTCCPFRQLVQNALDVGWVAIIGDRFTIDVERCWWVLAVCGIGSGFVAEVHLRGGLWSGEHALPR